MYCHMKCFHASYSPDITRIAGLLSVCKQFGWGFKTYAERKRKINLTILWGDIHVMSCHMKCCHVSYSADSLLKIFCLSGILHATFNHWCIVSSYWILSNTTNALFIELAAKTPLKETVSRFGFGFWRHACILYSIVSYRQIGDTASFKVFPMIS